MLCLDFDEEYQVMVDQQGLLVPMGDLVWIVEHIRKHVAHSKLELEAIARRTVEENAPSMVNQMNWDYFK